MGRCRRSIATRDTVISTLHLLSYAIGRNLTDLEKLLLLIALIDAVCHIGRRTRQLPSVHRYGCQEQRARGVHDPLPVLPLHHPARLPWFGGVGDGAIVGFLVVAVVAEGVGDAGVIGLDELVVDGVVEALGI